MTPNILPLLKEFPIFSSLCTYPILYLPKTLHQPVSINHTISKLKELQKHSDDTIKKLGATSKAIDLLLTPNSVTLNTAADLAGLDKHCDFRTTIVSLWRTVYCTPHWNLFNPLYYIQKGWNFITSA